MTGENKIKVYAENRYTAMQKLAYSIGTTNHDEHNQNPDYWHILLGELNNTDLWENKVALDFGCGKGRNVVNIHSKCNWTRVDGIDLSEANIHYCKNNYPYLPSNWYTNNGIDVSVLNDNEYDFILSTITLQHIPVYDIRKNIITDLFRVLKPNGIFSFQMAYGEHINTNENVSSYFENYYDARGTNSANDVRIENIEDVVNDLQEIGFVNVKTEIRNSYSDDGHPYWIYVKCSKK